MKNDYSEFNTTTIDAAALAAKISAGGSMKSAIREYLDDCEGCLRKSCPKHRDLRKALNKWNNLG